MAATTKHPGPVVTIDGVGYVLPKLSFGGFKRASAKIRDIAEGRYVNPSDLQDAVADVIHEALQRNYPELARETLLEALDWDSAQEAFSLVMKISVPAPTAGEQGAESPSGASTGTQQSPT